MADQHFWGTGWSFPPSFESSDKQLRLVHDVECINQSLQLIMRTQLGERAMNPNFGSPLHSFVFKHINSNILGQIRQSLADAILRFEPRIKVEHISVSQQQQTQPALRVELHYQVVHTNTRHNFVYPFAITEGTLLAPKQKGIL